MLVIIHEDNRKFTSSMSIKMPSVGSRVVFMLLILCLSHHVQLLHPNYSSVVIFFYLPSPRTYFCRRCACRGGRRLSQSHLPLLCFIPLLGDVMYAAFVGCVARSNLDNKSRLSKDVADD